MKKLIPALFAAGILAACSPKLPEGVDDYALQQAVADTVGDASTCVVLSDMKTGRKVWSQGMLTACTAAWPSCAPQGGRRTVEDLAKDAAKGATVKTGCESVSWAAGPVGDSGLAYAAVMRGERALPGMEIARRLEAVFGNAGL